jgi:hypothetical protein
LWVQDINEKALGEMAELGVTCCLSSVGKAVTRRRIREERRKDTEWRVKIIVTILTALTGVGGIIVGILALLR